MYAHVANEETGTTQANACIECGKCEEKCPQKIKIMEQLKESHEALKA
jgi:predicted aldo/keto reductase-like oxidoreductase